MPFAVQPAQEDGDGARVVAEVVRRPGDDPKLGRAVAVAEHASIEDRDGLVVGPVQDQQWPG